ncbi:semialdehyde dehydrogenase [Nitratireductor aestuarii]|uniref:Semialdehyde dehydrogenase n=1 Tax=Nitratireductor aestuarii TaxID=1735103 RepID=A0A916S0G9_9HYPH|nr:phosphogluconate dehydrogenase C-terminal domain-containing protein [Nitratireductor aestuarii]GGA78337.1 semialdehyde dehydrogenase [Nitratireductor aestuarii]
MATSIAILGSGGKMGFRITKKLVDAGYDVRAVEISDAGRSRLAEAGITATDAETGVRGAKVVVLALPDNIIGRVAADLSPQLESGTMLLILDAAAPYAGDLPDRPDLTYFVGHPCHPPLFNDETEWDARRDYHGGIAKQSIVCALMQGPEEHYALGEEICRAMWSPIINAYRVTTEQLAILEPGLSEMVAMPFVDTMVEAVEECEKKYGIPREAAMDFLIGHLNVEIAMWFGFSPKVPSDAALRLMRFAKGVVVRDEWRDALSPAKVKEAAELIVYGKGA